VDARHKAGHDGLGGAIASKAAPELLAILARRLYQLRANLYLRMTFSENRFPLFGVMRAPA